MSLAQSIFTRPSDLDPRTVRGTAGAAGPGAKLLLALTIATVLALAAIDTYGGKPSLKASESAQTLSALPGQAPILDGRGKWSGYLR